MILGLMLLYLFTVFCVYDNVVGLKNDQKRLLVSDPSSIETQLEQLQSEIQDLQVQTSSQQTVINDLKTTVTNQQAVITDLANTGRGTIFVRWGRMKCPTNFSTLYSGFAGGSFFTHTGAAADYQCLPPDPILGPHKDMYQGSDNIGYMFGAEFQETFDRHLYQDEVPCTVCYTSSHSMSVMIPARTSCYPGWTEAYRGDLASGRYANQAASQYVCLDENPEPIPGNSHVNENGKLFFAVKAQCGSLRCPPYVNNTLLPCVVCVK